MISDGDLNGVLAVVVIYERTWEQVNSLSYLLGLLNSTQDGYLRLRHVLVYDNSRHPQDKAYINPNYSYINNPKNEGTAAAYMYALQLAKNLNLGWLLLLDHDTLIPQNFFAAAASVLMTESLRPAAMLPWVVHADRPVSPACVTLYGGFKPINRESGLFTENKLTGISSASLIDRISFENICPIPIGLWLDYVDHWIFLELNKQKKIIKILPAVVQHELSIYETGAVSRTRLFSILDAESLFVSNLSWLARFVYPLRIFARLLQKIFSDSKGAIYMLEWMFQRLKKAWHD